MAKHRICTACVGTGTWFRSLADRLRGKKSICGKCWGLGYIEY